MLLLTACGGRLIVLDNCEYRSGITICSEGEIFFEDVDTAIPLIENRLREVYPNVTNLANRFAKHGIWMGLIDDKLATECQEIEAGIYRCEDYIGGVATDEGKKLYVQYRKCLAHTAFAHELLHSVEYIYFGESEGDHDAWKMFSQSAEDQGLKYWETIEYKSEVDIFNTTLGCEEFRKP